MNNEPVETSIRLHTDERKGYGDVTHSLTIDKVEVEDGGEIKAVATNIAGETTNSATLTVEGMV